MITNFKTYESIKFLSPYKKYLVWKVTTSLNSGKSFTILNVYETVGVSIRFIPHEIRLRKRYTISDEDYTIKSALSTRDFSYTPEEIKKKIIYDSDDIEEVLEILPELLNIDKYNL